MKKITGLHIYLLNYHDIYTLSIQVDDTWMLFRRNCFISDIAWILGFVTIDSKGRGIATERLRVPLPFRKNLGPHPNETPLRNSWTYPIPSMYGIFTYIYQQNQPNAGKYSIHGLYGYDQGLLKTIGFP